MKTIVIGGGKISIHDVWTVSHGAKVQLSESIKEKIKKSRAVVDEVVNSGKVVYGVNTGFGALQGQSISAEETGKLQENLIRSHAASVGKPYSREIIRAAMFVRLISNSMGHSGIRLEVLEKLAELLNRGITPVVPSMGSVGCSGDLSPLSHCMLVLMGEGLAEYEGEVKETKEIFSSLGMSGIKLAAKEGLALNNGTSFMTGIAALNLHKALNLIKTADVCAALTLEATQGFADAFDERIHKVRPHKGQAVSALKIRELIKGSENVGNLVGKGKVQDAYALRCTPQVHGAVRDTIDHCARVIETEINSVTDNPLVFPGEGDILSGGNFHGEPIAFVMDFLSIVLTDLGNLSERRTYRLLDSNFSNGLPGCLSGGEVGLNSGMMIPQYTAASLCNLNKSLAHPASIDTIPTGGNQEDHVSFGTNAAGKCYDIIFNVENILAIELLAAAQGIDLREPQKRLGKGTAQCYEFIRHRVPKLEEDREQHKDIKRLQKFISNFGFAYF
jgi:histidine ammonia-lyase